MVTTFAGSAGVSGSTDGTGAAARFNLPIGVGVDSTGVVYVADSGNHTIRKVEVQAECAHCRCRTVSSAGESLIPLLLSGRR